MTELSGRVRGWSMARQGLTDPAPTPLNALEGVTGVYSAHPSAPLSLAVRCAELTSAGFRSLEERHDVVRIPAMRVSIFMVPAASVATVFTATAMLPDVLARRVTSRGLDLGEYRKLTPRVLAAAQEARAPADLVEAATRSGKIDGVAIGTVLRMLAYEGKLVRVGAAGLRSDTVRYIATDVWLGHSLDPDPSAEARDIARAWLAVRYLAAFGPARVADFAWWAGLTKGDALRAIAAHDTVDVGEGLLLPAPDEAAFAKAVAPKGSVVLLPKWDPYTMAYAPDGRARLVDPVVQPRVYPGMGDGLPAVLVDGEIVGLWTLNKGAPATLDLFAPLAKKVRAEVDRRFEQVRALLDTP
jgi:hypothetical protein